MGGGHGLYKRVKAATQHRMPGHEQGEERIPALKQPAQCGVLEPSRDEEGFSNVGWPNAGCQSMGRVMKISYGYSNEDGSERLE